MKSLLLLFLAIAPAIAQTAIAAATTCPSIATAPWASVPANGLFLSISTTGVLTVSQCIPGTPTPAVIWTAPRYAEGEVPAGTMNGTNRLFALTHTPATGSTPLVIRNGIVLKAGVDYTITAYGVLQFLAAAHAPQAGDVLQVWYRY